ncbi:MAG: DUF6889 family protein [Schwartzia sp. (in: firmicutes)]
MANRPLRYSPAEYANVNAWLYAPVIAGRWRQHELWDGTYTLDDLLDVHEIMTVEQENRFRAEEAAEREGAR